MPEVAQEEDVKNRLRRLVADNMLPQATKQLVAIADDARYGDYRTRVLGFQSRTNAYLEDIIGGAIAPEALTRTCNQLSLDMFGLIDALPDEAALTEVARQPPGVSEAKLKRRLFWLLLVGKLLVLLYVFVLVDTGSGLTNQDFMTVLGILIPMFGAYLAVMVQNDTKNRRIVKAEDVRVNKDFARKAYLFAAVYPVLLCLLLYLRAIGTIPSVAALTVGLGLAESGWGVYLGKVVLGMYAE